MMSKTEPWYIYAALYVVIAILTYLLIYVAVIEPGRYIESENFNREESRLRMKNIKEAQVLFQKKHGHFTAHIDSLLLFINTPYVDSVRNSFDSLRNREADPFLALSHGTFSPESLMFTPKSHQRYVLLVDSSLHVDSVVNVRGKLLRVDTSRVIGSRYLLEDPDGYGKVGDLYSDGLKNVLSWE